MSKSLFAEGVAPPRRLLQRRRGGTLFQPRCWCRSTVPFVFTARTMSCKSPMPRARRSILVTIRTSPLRRNSSTVLHSSRPLVLVPLRFSDRMTSQPAALSAASWISRFWSVVLTRPYPITVIGSPVSFGSRQMRQCRLIIREFVSHAHDLEGYTLMMQLRDKPGGDDARLVVTRTRRHEPAPS